MKGFIAIILLCSLCLLLCVGCSSGTAEPQIRYENENAYYVGEGASYSMDLQFEEPVAEGSIISLQLEEEEILSFTAEQSFSRLRLSSPRLELDKPYILKVNGIVQRHGMSRPQTETTEPGYIPEPTIPTVPQEPMGEILTPTVSDDRISETVGSVETTSEEADDGDSIFDNPPTIDEEAFSQKVSESGEQGTSNLPSANEILTTEPLNADKVNKENSALDPNVQLGGTTFVLTGTVTGFTAVQNAS